MTFTFNGEPPGYTTPTSGYTESGMNFWTPYGPENLALVGAGVSGTPQDGTAYLQVTAGAKLAFSLTSGVYFGVVSFDAAGYNTDFPGASLEVVGYHPMGATVTNYFTVASFLDRRANSLPDFETFYPDSQFQNVYRVDVLTARWSLDNVVISGVPEPSAGVLILLGTLCGFGWRWGKGKRAARGGAAAGG